MVATVNVSSGQTLGGGTVSGLFLVVRSGGSIVGEMAAGAGSVFVQSGGTATGTVVSGRWPGRRPQAAPVTRSKGWRAPTSS